MLVLHIADRPSGTWAAPEPVAIERHRPARAHPERLYREHEESIEAVPQTHPR
jgi:hypothetical protein